MKNRRSRRRPGGFTLIEVLLVLVILVILGSLAVGGYMQTLRRARIDAAKAQIGLLKTPLETYCIHIGYYPMTAQGLSALWQRPADLSNPEKWDGPYMDPMPLDPWGHPYQYMYPGRYNPDKFDVWSVGPDGIDGTADDIGNWLQE
jgi:general secretion pathway protein G